MDLLHLAARHQTKNTYQAYNFNYMCHVQFLCGKPVISTPIMDLSAEQRQKKNLPSS
jgi:hypothetical protein